MIPPSFRPRRPGSGVPVAILADLAPLPRVSEAVAAERARTARYLSGEPLALPRRPVAPSLPRVA